MTITEDASQPGPVQITGTSGSSGPFSPPACLLVAVVAVDGPLTNTQQNSNVVSDSGTHTWVRKTRGNTFVSSALSGSTEVWECQLTSPPGSITVSTAWTGANGGELVVRVLKGAAADQSTAATNTAGGTSIAPTVAVTPTQIGSHVYGAALDWTTNAVLTPNGNTTSIGQFADATDGDTWAAWSAAADTASLVSTTFGYTNANAAYNLAAAEILADTAALGSQPTPFHPGRGPTLARFRQRPGAFTGGPQTQTISLAGTVAPAGGLAKQIGKPLTGAATPVGALAKLIGRAFTGTVTPSGALTRLTGKPLAGATTPAGAVTRQTGKPLAGTIGPAGTITKRIGKTLTGSVTLSGAVQLSKVILLALGGTITAAGQLTRQVGKPLAGTVNPTGQATKRTGKTLTGVATPAGAVAKTVGKQLAGAVTAAGTVTRLVHKTFSAVIATAGVLTTHGGSSSVPARGPATARSTTGGLTTRSTSTVTTRSTSGEVDPK